LTVLRQNLDAASSRIRDVDVAQESTEFAKENILVQSGTAMLAQSKSSSTERSSSPTIIKIIILALWYPLLSERHFYINGRYQISATGS
jgi:hypothetical protein